MQFVCITVSKSCECRNCLTGLSMLYGELKDFIGCIRTDLFMSFSWSARVIDDHIDACRPCGSLKKYANPKIFPSFNRNFQTNNTAYVPVCFSGECKFHLKLSSYTRLAVIEHYPELIRKSSTYPTTRITSMTGFQVFVSPFSPNETSIFCVVHEHNFSIRYIVLLSTFPISLSYIFIY